MRYGLKSQQLIGVLLTFASSWVVSGCAEVSVPFQATGTPDGSSSTCSTSVVDYGQKGSVAAVARGTYSDTKFIPGLTSAATAYSDPSSLSLKFSYWNGTGFSTEIISGDGTATFVRLVFLSDGTPIVLWTLGAYLKTAIRSAPLGTAGTWNAGVIDSGVAPRAVEASVNPLGQVAVTFLTDTATTGRAKFLYCDSPCSLPSNFQTMTPNAYIENTALVAAQVSTGSAWCKVDATTYYPAAVYSVTGEVKYAVCRNSLSNCLSSTNWETATVVASGNVANSLHLDPNVTGDVPKMISKEAAGIVTYRMGNTSCTAAPVAPTAGVTLGTASSGTQWLKLLKDPAGKFHVISNEANTSVRYYNSTTTDILDPWNGAGVVETVAFAAAQGGGGDIEPSSSTLALSYGTGAAPYDIRQARVNDLSAASSSAVFTRLTADTTGSIQLTAANTQQSQFSVRSTSAGRPAIAYVDFSNGAATGAKLKYAYRDAHSAESAWTISQAPGTISPQQPGLAFDHLDRPWISYFDLGNTRFYLTTNSRSDGTGTWSTYEFPATPSGAPIALPAANDTAVGMHYSGGTAQPVIAVIDNNATSRGLKTAKLNPTTLTWSATVIDALGVSGASHLSMDHDTSGNLVLAFRDLTATRAKYSSSVDGTSWTAPLAVSGVNQGMGVKVRINPLTSFPAMSYFDRGANSLYYAPCTGGITACAVSGWFPTLVDSAVGISGLAAGNEQLLSAGLSFHPENGIPSLLFPKGQGSLGSLAMAEIASTTTISTLKSGTNGSLLGSAAANFGIAGWGVSATRNAADGITALYLGPGNWLYSTSCGD